MTPQTVSPDETLRTLIACAIVAGGLIEVTGEADGRPFIVIVVVQGPRPERI